MKTLFCLEQTSLCCITRLSPLKPKATTTLQPRRTWKKVHAKAKGYSGASNNIQEKKRMPKETVPERSYQKPNENDEDDDKIPQVVLDRMIVRILIYVGVPLVTGLVILQGFSIVKEENLVDIPVWLPFFTTFITFGASALGIAIGTLSASWDPDRKGSLLGFEEAQRNWVEMWKEEDETHR